MQWFGRRQEESPEDFWRETAAKRGGEIGFLTFATLLGRVVGPAAGTAGPSVHGGRNRLVRGFRARQLAVENHGRKKEVRKDRDLVHPRGSPCHPAGLPFRGNALHCGSRPGGEAEPRLRRRQNPWSSHRPGIAVRRHDAVLRHDPPDRVRCPVSPQRRFRASALMISATFVSKASPVPAAAIRFCSALT